MSASSVTRALAILCAVAGSVFAADIEIPLPPPFDVFADSAGAEFSRLAEAACAKAKGSSDGVYKLSQLPDQQWLEAIRRLTGGEAGKELYVGFLKDKYEYNINRLNEAYGLDSQSFTDLTGDPFKTLDRKRPAVESDDREMVATIRETVLRLLKEALARCDSKRALKET